MCRFEEQPCKEYPSLLLGALTNVWQRLTVPRRGERQTGEQQGSRDELLARSTDDKATTVKSVSRGGVRAVNKCCEALRVLAATVLTATSAANSVAAE